MKELKNLIKEGAPLVIIVLSQEGLEKSFVFYEEENAEALEQGNLLLARISCLLSLLDNAVRHGGDRYVGAVEARPQRKRSAGTGTTGSSAELVAVTNGKQ